MTLHVINTGQGTVPFLGALMPSTSKIAYLGMKVEKLENGKVFHILLDGRNLSSENGFGKLIILHSLWCDMKFIYCLLAQNIFLLPARSLFSGLKS